LPTIEERKRKRTRRGKKKSRFPLCKERDQALGAVAGVEKREEIDRGKGQVVEGKTRETTQLR